MNYKVGLLKIIFSFLSLLLMFPLMLRTEPDFYTTLFIFMIDRVVDLIFEKGISVLNKFFYVWSTINLIFGILVCSFVLAFLSESFMKIVCSCNIITPIHYAMFAVAFSYLVKDFILLLYVRRKQLSIASDIEMNHI